MKFSSRYLVVSFLLLLLFGCKSLPDNPPIPMDKMSKVILDIQIAEIYSQGLGDSVKNKFEKNYDSLSGFYISVLKHYNLSYNDYTDAMEWYKDHPVLMDSLLGKVSKELTVVKSKEKIKEVPSNPSPVAAPVVSKTDSLKKVDSLKKASLHDTIPNKNKVMAKPNVKDTLSKKSRYIKREL